MKDPVHELEMSRALLQQAQSRLEALPTGEVELEVALRTLVRGLQAEVAWWEPRALRAVRA